MAICAGDYLLWHILRCDGKLPPRPAVVEIGEANWYGDVPLNNLREDFGIQPTGDPFHIAKQFYKALLDYSSIVAIDLSGRPGAKAYDLNRPIARYFPQFDVLINTGTIEHVFDQRQAWQTCHELTRPNGLMVHLAPVCGWFNHGFYAMQPTMISDLAAANDYTLEAMTCTHGDTAQVATPNNLPAKTGNVMLHWAWRKPATNRIFKTPQQGYYAGTLSGAEYEAWGKER